MAEPTSNYDQKNREAVKEMESWKKSHFTSLATYVIVGGEAMIPAAGESEETKPRPADRPAGKSTKD